MVKLNGSGFLVFGMVQFSARYEKTVKIINIAV